MPRSMTPSCCAGHAGSLQDQHHSSCVTPVAEQAACACSNSACPTDGRSPTLQGLHIAHTSPMVEHVPAAPTRASLQGTLPVTVDHLRPGQPCGRSARSSTLQRCPPDGC